MRRENRGPWYLLTGVALGVVIGVLYSWMLSPVNYTNTRPASLHPDFKDRYRALIAAAYMANGDLARARSRLELLKDEDIYRALAEQAQRTLAGGADVQEAQALGVLAIALGQPPESSGGASATTGGTASPGASLTSTLPGDSAPDSLSPSSGGTPSSPAVTLTRPPRPTATFALVFTALPTRTATPTLVAPFVLDRQDLACDVNNQAALIQIVTLDKDRQEVPAVEIIVSWPGGEDHFFTGLKPEISLGYADFDMIPGVVYTVRLASGGQAISNLSAQECEDQGGNRYYGSWQLTFIQP